MPRDIDQESRRKIREDIKSNLFVEAGAGSGKTTVLVDRMVSMVEAGIDISKICAITFTTAAANEFYSRFQEKLSKSKSEKAKEALKNIDLCFMGTIDSFCNMILSEHPSRAGIPSDSHIISDDDAEILYVKEYSKILKGELGDAKLLEKAKRFSGCFYNAKELFIKGVATLLKSRDAVFEFAAPPTQSVDDLLKDEKARVLEILDYLYTHEEALQGEKPQTAEVAKRLVLDEIESFKEPWDANLRNITSKLSTLAGLRIVKEYEPKMDEMDPGWDRFFCKHFSKEKFVWYDVNTDEDGFLEKKLKSLQMSIALDFIKDAAPVVALDLKEQGLLSFSDYLYYLRDLLKEDAKSGGKLIKHISERHSYYLCDEAQDCDPVQYQLLFYLAAEHPNEDWTKCTPREGSLFFCLDPKQSIYHFRQADILSVMKVKKLFEDPSIGEVVALTRNFRSTDVMCSWFNEVFINLLSEETETQSKFSPIPTGEKQQYTASLNGVYRYEIQNSQKKEELEDPGKVAEIIRRIIDDPKISIQDRDADGKAQPPRRPSYGDFMIITPSKGNLSYYMNAMTAYGIPYKIEGKALFNECPALISIHSIMSAIADPFDDAAMFAAEYLSGCTLAKESIYEYVKKTKEESSASLFTRLLEEEKIFEKVGTDNAEYAYFALELLRSAQTDGTVTSLKEGAEFLCSLINNESGEERCIQLSQNSDRVHIANLHKIKGLEKPIVILAEPKSKAHPPEKRVDYSVNPPKGYIFNLGGSLTSKDFENEKDREKETLAEEGVRLLYVAATRAGCALIIGDSYNKSGRAGSNPWLPFIEDDIPLIDSKISADIVAKPVDITYEDAAKPYKDAADSSVLLDRASEEKGYEIKRPSTITLKGLTSSEDDYEDQAKDKIPAKKSKENPTLIGTMVHRVMEVLVSSAGKASDDKLIAETLKEYNADDKYYSDILQGVVKTIRSGGYAQVNGVPQDILTELISANETHCELPFCFGEGKKIWHGIMDVAYLKDDKWHIVDYKTNADASDLDEHYKEQLAAYIKAFKEMTGEDADALIYHIAV